jgi:hypothetical protein
VKTNPEIEAKNRSSITRTCPVTYSNSKAIHSTKADLTPSLSNKLGKKKTTICLKSNMGLLSNNVCSIMMRG